jgi:uncharacterized protein
MVNQKLVDYIEKNILPYYDKNDFAHDIRHAKNVILRSLELADKIDNANCNIVYTLACYHDIAYSIDHKNHEILGTDILLNDKFMQKFFSRTELAEMAEVLRRHDSKLDDNENVSIYRKILCSADADSDIDICLWRNYEYRRAYYPELSQEEIIEECWDWLDKNFCDNGKHRSKFYIRDEKINKFLEDVNILLADKNKFVRRFKEAQKIKKSEQNG